MREKAPFPIRLGDDRSARDFERGLRFASKGHYRDALRCFDKVLAMAPAHLGALNSRGDCLALLGQHEQAIAASISSWEVGRSTSVLETTGRVPSRAPVVSTRR
jgi:tetratricopeptide (TPR) repeat protein